MILWLCEYTQELGRIRATYSTQEAPLGAVIESAGSSMFDGRGDDRTCEGNFSLQFLPDIGKW